MLGVIKLVERALDEPPSSRLLLAMRSVLRTRPESFEPGLFPDKARLVRMFSFRTEGCGNVFLRLEADEGLEIFVV